HRQVAGTARRYPPLDMGMLLVDEAHDLSRRGSSPAHIGKWLALRGVTRRWTWACCWWTRRMT
ncbi:hypothetical protein C7E25_25290, partial [Stenotrophomonas maltophilia]